MNITNLITCPKCKAEYLPAEIFLPNELLGKPYSIEKDEDGKIKNFLGNSMNLNEEYICDYCKTPLKISINPITFSIKYNDKSSVKEVYKTTLNKSKFNLDET